MKNIEEITPHETLLYFSRKSCLHALKSQKIPILHVRDITEDQADLLTCIKEIRDSAK